MITVGLARLDVLDRATDLALAPLLRARDALLRVHPHEHEALASAAVFDDAALIEMRAFVLTPTLAGEPDHAERLLLATVCR